MKNTMKFFFVVLFVPIMVAAQIPNAGFENWTNANPDSWHANNEQSVYTTVISTSTAHSGSLALRGDTKDFFSVILSPTIQAGTDARGFAFTQRPSSFSGYYQFSPVGGDRFSVNVSLYKGGVDGVSVGSGAQIFDAAVSAYTQFTVPISYGTNDVPDTCVIQIMIFGPANNVSTYHLGSYYLLDDLAFSGSTGISDIAVQPTEFQLLQNYPNPFNPTTSIQYSVPNNQMVNLKIYDALGREVATLVNEIKESGIYSTSFDASSLSSGIYFARLQSGDKVQLKKMLMLK